MLSPRNRELLGLVPSALLVTAGFTAIFVQEQNNSPRRTPTSCSPATGASLATARCSSDCAWLAHLVLRFALPDADPYMLPLAAVLASIGIVMVYRIEPVLARQQAQWMILGLVLFAATIIALRQRGVGVLERYRYTIALVGIIAALLPRLPGIGGEVNGAYLAIHLGSVTFQTAELAKVAIVIFLASYLRDNRQILVTAGRRVLGMTLPPMKQFGPLLAVWGAGDGDAADHPRARDVADVLRSLSRAAVRRDRALLLPAHRDGALRASARISSPTHVGHVESRVEAWEEPFSPRLYNAPGGSYQLAQSLFAQSDGGVLGTGFDRSLLPFSPGTRSCRCPKAT